MKNQDWLHTPRPNLDIVVVVCCVIGLVLLVLYGHDFGIWIESVFDAAGIR